MANNNGKSSRKARQLPTRKDLTVQYARKANKVCSNVLNGRMQGTLLTKVKTDSLVEKVDRFRRALWWAKSDFPDAREVGCLDKAGKFVESLCVSPDFADFIWSVQFFVGQVAILCGNNKKSETFFTMDKATDNLMLAVVGKCHCVS